MPASSIRNSPHVCVRFNIFQSFRGAGSSPFRVHCQPIASSVRWTLAHPTPENKSVKIVKPALSVKTFPIQRAGRQRGSSLRLWIECGKADLLPVGHAARPLAGLCFYRQSRESRQCLLNPLSNGIDLPHVGYLTTHFATSSTGDTHEWRFVKRAIKGGLPGFPKQPKAEHAS